MKATFIIKSMILFFVCAGVTSIALGQTNPNTKMPSSPVVTGKVPVVRPLPEKKFFVVRVSSTTTNSDSNTQVRVWMDYTDNVPVLKWEASSPIIKIIMNFKNGSNSTWSAKEGETSGYFMMNSGAYANKGTYLIEFYESGHSDKHIWVAVVEQSTLPGQ
jgi:hypothetical protein